MLDKDLLQMALGFEVPWFVETVDFDAAEKRIDIAVAFPKGSRFTCPTCGQSKNRRDGERQRRHDSAFVREAVIAVGLSCWVSARISWVMPSRAPVMRRKRVAASATAATVHRMIILPPRHRFTRSESRRMEPIKFSIAFVVESWRSSFLGSRRRFTAIVSSRPSSSEEAAPG